MPAMSQHCPMVAWAYMLISMLISTLPHRSPCMSRLPACHITGLLHGGTGVSVCTPDSRTPHLMRQSRLTCLHVGCVGFHHVASCEHPFCMPTICQYCYVVAQACPVYTPAVFQHYRVITQAFLFTCLSHTRATTYCPGFPYLRE